MNTPGFIRDNLKAARLLLGLSQIDLARACGMQQKDVSLHENKDTKKLIPVRYILFLYSKGIDLNSIFRPGEVRMLSSMERASLAAEPQAPYQKLRQATETERKLRHSAVPLSPDELRLLREMLAERSAQARKPDADADEQGE